MVLWKHVDFWLLNQDAEVQETAAEQQSPAVLEAAAVPAVQVPAVVQESAVVQEPCSEAAAATAACTRSIAIHFLGCHVPT